MPHEWAMIQQLTISAKDISIATKKQRVARIGHTLFCLDVRS
jgi:hypothetical protein